MIRGRVRKAGGIVQAAPMFAEIPAAGGMRLPPFMNAEWLFNRFYDESEAADPAAQLRRVRRTLAEFEGERVLGVKC